MNLSQGLFILKRARKLGYVNSGYHNCVRLYAGNVTIAPGRYDGDGFDGIRDGGSEDVWANYCFCPVTLIAWIKLGLFFHQNQWKRAAAALGMSTEDAAHLVNGADYLSGRYIKSQKIRRVLMKFFPI